MSQKHLALILVPHLCFHQDCVSSGVSKGRLSAQYEGRCIPTNISAGELYFLGHDV